MIARPVAALFLVAACAWACSRGAAPPTLVEARAFARAQPRHLRPVPVSPVPAGLADVRAESCGACHVEIYAEWRVSTHARAWLDDAQFQEELRKTTAVPGRDASWICVNCHTPYEAQLPRLVARLEDGDKGRPVYVDNPNFDPALQREAITCATCHVVDGVVIGPFGDGAAPHPVRKSEALLGIETCTQCHQAEDWLEDVGVGCAFDTGGEFQRGPHAAEGKTCQSCHMPEVVRPIAVGSTVLRRSRRHWFGGSLIPKHPDFAAEVDAVRKHYPEGAMLRLLDPPEALAAGQRARLRFDVTNAEAGHRLPTGDPERWLLVRLEVFDSGGLRLAVREERFGARYRFEPRMELLEDTRLEPRETRAFDLEFVAPAAGSVEVVLEGTKGRIGPEAMRFHDLEGRTVPSRSFAREVWAIPVR